MKYAYSIQQLRELLEMKRTQRLQLERADQHELANEARNHALDLLDAIAALEMEQKRIG